MVMVLPSSVPASFSAPPLASRLRACNSDFIDSKRALFSLVARSALPRGSRKLRAKPSFTRTTSPIWPSRATRSSRITSMSVSPCSADHVGQQTEKPRALDRLRELALLLCRHGGDTAWHDLAAFRHEALQQLDVLIVDLRRVGAGERAALAAAEERP